MSGFQSGPGPDPLPALLRALAQQDASRVQLPQMLQPRPDVITARTPSYYERTVPLSVRQALRPRGPEAETMGALLSALASISGLKGDATGGLSAVGGPVGQASAVFLRGAPKILAEGDDVTRLARAKDMGFNVDEPLYHGTKGYFEEFSLRHTGKVAADKGERAVFLTPDPGEAEHYAQLATVREARRGETPHSPGSPAHGLGPVVYDKAAIMPLVVRGKLKEVRMSHYNSNAFKKELYLARKEGFDGVRFKGVNERGQGARGVDQIAVFDPANVRSRFDAFEAKK